MQEAVRLFQARRYPEAIARLEAQLDRDPHLQLAWFMKGLALEESDALEEAERCFQQVEALDDSQMLFLQHIEVFRRRHYRDTTGLTAFHYFPRTRNLGDTGSAAGARRCLREVLPELRFIGMNCGDASLPAATINREAALLLIGGGGLFFNRPCPAGWYFAGTPEELDQVRVPVIPYGIGLNQESFSSHSAWQLDQAFDRRLERALRRFSLRCGRDHWTVEHLEALCPDLPVHLVPCPSIFLPPLPHLRFPRADRPAIALNLTDRVEPALQATLTTEAAVLARALAQSGHQVTFVIHDAADDTFMESLARQTGAGIYQPTTAREAISFYASQDLLLGMRGHSLLFAMAAGTPFLCFSYNRKCDAFMTLCGLEEACRPASHFTAPAALAMIERAMADREALRTRILEARGRFQQLNRAYCERIRDLLPDRLPPAAP